ncbi:MAG: hypothetical protein HY791_03175 [Deltaproteobacteria bacterium]|nr:hypothetical protein [Deltaproteobacteria bacterium]
MSSPEFIPRAGPSSASVGALACMMASACSSDLVELSWPEGRFRAVYIVTTSAAEVVDVEGPLRDDESYSGELGAEGRDTYFVGLDEAAIADLVRADRTFARAEPRYETLRLKARSCEFDDFAALPASASIRRLEASTMRFVDARPTDLDSKIELVLDPRVTCPDSRGRLVPFGREPNLLPNGTVVYGISRERSGQDKGSRFLNLDGLYRVDEDRIVARSAVVIYLFERDLPYSDDLHHRFASPATSEILALCPKPGGDAGFFAVTRGVLGEEAPRVFEVGIEALGLRLIRTATIPTNSARGVACWPSGRTVITTDAAVLTSTAPLGPFKPLRRADLTPLGVLRGTSEEFILYDSTAKVIFAGDVDEYESASLDSALFVDVGLLYPNFTSASASVLRGEGDGAELWVAGVDRSVVTPPGLLVRRGDASWSRQALPSSSCGELDACGRRRTVAVNDMAIAELPSFGSRLVVVGDACRAVAAFDPVTTCQVELAGPTEFELKAISTSEEWLTVAGKEGTLLEQRLR